MSPRFILAIGLLALVGCHRNQGYKIVSFSIDPSVANDPTLGHKITLERGNVHYVAHCWLSETESPNIGCPLLESEVGETVVLDYWKLGDKTLSDVLVYRPHGTSDNKDEEMIRVASANAN